MQSGNARGEAASFRVRKLELFDKGKGFIELLQQLSVCDSVSDKEFEARFHELSALGEDHVICVIEDDCRGKIIATGSVYIEGKFVRNCGKVGHIEDVVVDRDARGMHLGKLIIEFLTDHARSVGCYKVILDCSVENRGFYEKCGFKQKEIQMARSNDRIEVDESQAKKWNVEPLEVSRGPITRARAKRFKEGLNELIKSIQGDREDLSNHGNELIFVQVIQAGNKGDQGMGFPTPAERCRRWN